jgi:dipeptidyl aminopeptidase/acylaminoacyl peptidase
LLVESTPPRFGFFSRFGGPVTAALYSFATGEWRRGLTNVDRMIEALYWPAESPSYFARVRDGMGFRVVRVDSKTGMGESFLGTEEVIKDVGFSPRGDSISWGAGENYFAKVFLKRRGAREASVIADFNPQLRDVALPEQRRVTWRSRDGQTVDGVLVLPLHPTAHERLPLLVSPYGGGGLGTFQFGSEMMIGARDAERGYALLIPANRAPHRLPAYARDAAYAEPARGAKGLDVLVADIETGIEYLDREGIIDRDRVGLFGMSNGAYATNVLVTRSPMFRCAVSRAGESSYLYGYFMQNPAGWHQPIVGASFFQKPDDYMAMSPLYHLDHVTAPMLLAVGDNDTYWLPQVIMTFNGLRELGKKVTLLRYADEGHAFSHPDDVRDFWRRVDAFYDYYLKGDESARDAWTE